jgi:hypothetical protein
MMAPKVVRAQVTEAVEAIRWVSSAFDGESAREEARRRAKQVSPDCIALLSHVVRVDGFSSVPQRIRAACSLLQVAELLQTESKPTGLFGGEEASDASGREAD